VQAKGNVAENEEGERVLVKGNVAETVADGEGASRSQYS